MYTSYFSLKDAQKRFNINKIRYNVFDYSLKNKIIFEDLISFNFKNSIDSKSYGAEEQIQTIINTKQPTKYDYINSFNGVKFPHGDFRYTTHVDRKKLSGFTHTFMLNNDLYINLENLVWFLRINDIFDGATSHDYARISHCVDSKQLYETLQFIDNSELLDAIIQLICALTRKDSLISNLGWLVTQYETESLSNVDNLEMLRHSFNVDKKLGVYFAEGITCGWMPIQNATMIPHKDSPDGFNGGILDFQHLSQVSPYLEEALKIQYRKVLIFTIEILNAIQTVNSKYISKLHNLLLHNLGDHNLFIKNYLYDNNAGNIEINPKVKDIIEIKDMSERYEAIKEYVKGITDFPSKIQHLNNVEYVPVFLASFVQFCNDHSFRSIRVKIILYMLEILKDLGLPLKMASRDSEEVSEALGSMTGMDLDTGESENNDLFNFHFETYAETPIPDTPVERSAKVAKRTASNDILDRAAADFSENGYDFDIKTISNTSVSEATKARYNTIVSKVNLVCKNLTKQIRDIKTYNEGGKNPGLSSGKLDKKAIYRYKYDKNIFYNNTYKIKESDLAFGILLDISGSMRGEGIENGKATMIILHEVLKTLNINHCIATHNSVGEHQCNIKKYVQFKENANYNVNKCFSIAEITANYGNCDSGALYFMEQELMRTVNKDKICLIFSDGEPTECTSAELRDQVKHMERLGIKVIGIGINFESIKDYYNDYANGRALKEMLDIVSGILKQYVLDKKD